MNINDKDLYFDEVGFHDNFAFTLKDNHIFSLTQFQFSHQENNWFIEYVESWMNGKKQLYYLTSEYQSLENYLVPLTTSQFIDILRGVIRTILLIKEHGFLLLSNVLFNAKYIFVENNTMNPNIRFIYFPIESVNTPQKIAEMQIKTEIYRIIMNSQFKDKKEVVDILNKLKNPVMDLKDIIGNKPPAIPLNTGINANFKKMRIESLNPIYPVNFEITKNDFILGSKESLADGVISFSRKISRRHCQIIQFDNQFYLQDLNSLNGTFLNNQRCQPNTTYLLKDKDLIRLSSFEFLIIIY